MNDESLSTTLIEPALMVGLRSVGWSGGAPRLGGNLVVCEKTESTNDEVIRRAEAGAEEGLTVLAEHQSAGRGRSGNRWSAPPHRNLTFSVLLKSSLPVAQWPRFAHGAGLAVARGIAPWLGNIRAELKWPNDVYADGRKIAGILLELRRPHRDPYAVLGIGLNVNSLATEFPPELRHCLTSLRALSGGKEVSRNDLGGAILAELNRTIALCETDFPAILADVRRLSCLLGKQVRYRQHGTVREGTVVDFGEDGEMLVRIAGNPAQVEKIITAETVRVL